MQDSIRSNPLRWFTPSYALCIIAMSAETLRHAHGFADHHFWLPILEIVGALLLAIRPARTIGLAVLLVVFGFAFLVRLHGGDFATDLILYAATALYIDRAARREPSSA